MPNLRLLELLDDMISIHAEADAFEEMVLLLRERIELTEDTEKVVFIGRLVDVFSSDLERPGDGIALLEEYEALLYEDQGLRDQYQVLLTEEEQWDGLAKFYEARLSEVSDGPQRRDLVNKIDPSIRWNSIRVRWRWVIFHRS